MTTKGRGSVPLAARIFLVIAGLVVLGVGIAVALTWQVGERLGRQAVSAELDASTAAQRRFEDLGAEKLELIAQSIATDPSVANYLEGAIGGNLGLDGDLGYVIDDSVDELGMEPTDELGMEADELGVAPADELGADSADANESADADASADGESAEPLAAGREVMTAGSAEAGGNVSVQDLLEERRETQNFSLAMVLDPDGQLVARTGETEAFERDFKSDEFLRPVIEDLISVVGYWEEAGKLYHTAATPIAKDDVLVGFLVVGSEVDRSLCEQIQQVSGAHVAYWGAGSLGVRLLASSLDTAKERQLSEAMTTYQSDVAHALAAGDGLDRLDLKLGGENYSITLSPLLPQPGLPAAGGAMALTSADAAMASFLELRNNMLYGGSAAIIIALALSWWLARRILRPVAGMAQAAELAAAGDYQHNIPQNSRDELGRLARAFNALLSSLREKSDIEGYVSNLSRFLPDPGLDEGLSTVVKIEQPEREELTVLAVDIPELAKPVGEGSEGVELTKIGSRLGDLKASAEARQGTVLLTQGRQLVLGFRGAGRQVNALHLLQQLVIADARREPAARSGFALSDGETLHGSLPNLPGTNVAIGGAVSAAQRLLIDSGPGRVLVAPNVADGLKKLLGENALAVSAGGLSGKRFYALRIENLSALPEAASDDANATKIVSGEIEPAAPRSEGVGSQTRLAHGSIFAERYEIQSILGSGGMGVVYKARDRELDDFVALKMLRPGLIVDHEQLDRLKSEIKLARKITHPNVLRTYDFGESGGMPFISMEYVRGMTLRYLLEQAQRVPYSAGLRIARQLCAGLDAAHAVGVLHRDIKPENLILEQSGNAKLMDFGIARPIQRSAPGHTQPGMFVGTPAYSAPEQLQGEDLDARSDIYSTGIVICELFCGGLPFPSGNTMETYMAHLQTDPAKPSELWPDIPKELEQVILKCLNKKPDDRFGSAAELMVALSELRA